MDWKSGTGSKEKKKKKEFTIAKWTNNTTLFTPCGKGDGEKDVQNIFNEELYTPDCFDLLVSEDVIKYNYNRYKQFLCFTKKPHLECHSWRN